MRVLTPEEARRLDEETLTDLGSAVERDRKLGYVFLIQTLTRGIEAAARLQENRYDGLRG